MVKMDQTQLIDTLLALSDQISSGDALQNIFKRMATIQPEFSSEWNLIYQEVGTGEKIATAFRHIFSPDILISIRAGEQAGDLAAAIDEKRKSCELDLAIGQLLSKIYFPLYIGAAGLVVALCFLGLLIPMMFTAMENLPGAEDAINGFVYVFSQELNGYMTSPLIISLSIVTIGVIVYLVKTNLELRSMLYEFFLGVPVLGQGLTSIAFSRWSKSMTVLTKGGSVDISDALELSLEVLPKPLQGGVQLFMLDYLEQGIASASDPLTKTDTDPRRKWPYMIPLAFQVSESNGEISSQMNRASERLTAQGERLLTRFTSVANSFCIAIVMFLVLSPLALYYAEFAKVMQAAVGGLVR